MDELSLAPRSFFAMLLSRLSAPGAKLFATTNPDGPRHWLKTEYLDRDGLSVYRKKFLLEENPALEKAYIDSLKREYRGIFYKRFILGDWAAAQGAVYPMFDEARHGVERLPEMRFTWIGCDIGHTNPTAFVRLGAGKDGGIYVMDEFYHSAAQSGPMSPGQYAQALIRFAGGDGGALSPRPWSSIRRPRGLSCKCARSAICAYGGRTTRSWRAFSSSARRWIRECSKFTWAAAI